MKVRNVRFLQACFGALLAAMICAGALVSTPTVALASSSQPAKSREQILDRATKWVKKKVRYSQNGYYKGYRRDCSGFVSMAWGLRGSYTSSSIRSQAKRISIRNLKLGDAIRVPGHVSIFAGWKNKDKGLYYAMEQTTWGDHAKKHVRKIASNAVALRSKHLARPTVSAANYKASQVITA